MGRRTAAILVLREPEFEQRQWAMLLEYCAKRRVEPTALVRRDCAAAIALGEQGLVDVIVAVAPDRFGMLENAQCAVEFVRAVAPRSTSRSQEALVTAMLNRGGDVATVAQLLDLPLNVVTQIERTGGAHPASEVARRPERGRDCHASPSTPAAAADRYRAPVRLR